MIKTTVEKIFEPIRLTFDPDAEQQRILEMVPLPPNLTEFPPEVVNLQIPILNVRPLLNVEALANIKPLAQLLAEQDLQQKRDLEEQTMMEATAALMRPFK